MIEAGHRIDLRCDGRMTLYVALNPWNTPIRGRMQVLEDPMRFLNVAFVMTALSVSVSCVQAQDGISPEVFAACEAKTPNDFKQQLACVKEQAEALDAINALKKTKSRQIAVQPKVTEPVDTDTETEAEPEAKVAVAAPPTESGGFDTASAEAFCKTQTTETGAAIDWKACVESETSAHGALAAALASVDSDIPGDPYEACRNYIFAYQPDAAKVYMPQAYMLQCLQAKAPTRDFGKCYQAYEHRIYNRDVTSVSEENIGRVADCFVSRLEGAP